MSRLFFERLNEKFQQSMVNTNPFNIQSFLGWNRVEIEYFFDMGAFTYDVR